MAPRIKKICRQCGKSFMIMQCRLRDGNGKSCSNKCKVEYQTSNGKWYPEKNYQRIHITVMEKSLRRKLYKGEVVHHEDGNIRNNKLSNLVLFSSHSEHLKYHARKKKLAQGINPSIEKKCSRCKQIKPHNEFSKTINRKGEKIPASVCKLCAAIIQQERRNADREKYNAYCRSYYHAQKQKGEIT